MTNSLIFNLVSVVHLQGMFTPFENEAKAYLAAEPWQAFLERFVSRFFGGVLVFRSLFHQEEAYLPPSLRPPPTVTPSLFLKHSDGFTRYAQWKQLELNMKVCPALTGTGTPILCARDQLDLLSAQRQRAHRPSLLLSFTLTCSRSTSKTSIFTGF